MLDKDSPEVQQFKKIVDYSKNTTFDVNDSSEDEKDAKTKGKNKTVTYTESQELLEKWEALRKRYLPTMDSYAKKSMFQSLNEIISTDKFEA